MDRTRFRITTRTMMLAVLFAAAVVMHLQYVHFEDRWAELRERAERAAREEQYARGQAVYYAERARRIARGFASLGEYLEEFPGSNAWLPEIELAWLWMEGDVDAAPPPDPAFLQYEREPAEGTAEGSLREAEDFAVKKRTLLRRWW